MKLRINETSNQRNFDSTKLFFSFFKRQRFFEMSARNINQKTRKGEGKESICQQEIVMVFGFTPQLISKCGMSIIHILFQRRRKVDFFFKVREANWWRTGMLPAISQLHFCSWLNIFFSFHPTPHAFCSTVEEPFWNEILKFHISFLQRF